jgi:hypothetical protein
MSDEDTNTRRRFLHLAGVTALTAGLAGCGGGGGGNGGDGGDGGDTTTEGDGDTPTRGGDETTEPSGETTTEGGVPEAYVTATAQNGQQRNPDNLVAPSALAYQEEPKDGQQCSGCQFYITDKNGDGMGACTLITGTVDPQGWCNSYSPYETASQ